jgi:hypothetical protein
VTGLLVLPATPRSYLTKHRLHERQDSHAYEPDSGQETPYKYTSGLISQAHVMMTRGYLYRLKQHIRRLHCHVVSIHPGDPAG